MFFLFDPSVLFALSVILAPLALVNYPEQQIEITKEYISSPVIMVCVVIWLIIEIFFPVKSQKCSIAHWYLMNGIFFHILLDGLSGLLQIKGLMPQPYV